MFTEDEPGHKDIFLSWSLYQGLLLFVGGGRGDYHVLYERNFIKQLPSLKTQDQQLKLYNWLSNNIRNQMPLAIQLRPSGYICYLYDDNTKEIAESDFWIFQYFFFQKIVTCFFDWSFTTSTREHCNHLDTHHLLFLIVVQYTRM